VEVVLRHHDPELAAQAFGNGRGDLHLSNPISQFNMACHPKRRDVFTSPPSPRLRRTSFAAPPRRMVRAEGLEPPRLASLEPKSSASTSSATSASEPCRGRFLRPNRRKGAPITGVSPGC